MTDEIRVLAEAVAKVVFPHPGDQKDKDRLEGLLLEFAAEIRRSTLED